MSVNEWIPNFVHLSPAFELFSWLPPNFLLKNAWPNLSDYNALALPHPQSMVNSLGISIRFIDQSSDSRVLNEGYEPRIYLRGEVPTREENWHDLFNMLIWHTFPKVKNWVNQCHYHHQKKREGITKQRSPLENFLTLFDENGLVIVSSRPALLEMLRTRQWKNFFWHERDVMRNHLRCFVFGHSLHEKLLNPYIGMVGHSILFSVTDDFFQKDRKEQIHYIEESICGREMSTMTTRSLVPVPILGFAGWSPESWREDFYDNRQYFRPLADNAICKKDN